MRAVPEAGFEPARLAAKDFKSSAFTDFATRASSKEKAPRKGLKKRPLEKPQERKNTRVN